MYKAIVFDIGRTLVGYNKPLNWSTLYRPAFEHIAKTCNCDLEEQEYQHAIDVLTKYNTRINPREYEVTSEQIFSEIMQGTKIAAQDLQKVKHQFYTFFRRDSVMYPEVQGVIKRLSEKGILIGTLSDVAYGMDNQYVLDDISVLLPYIDFPFTSNDTGYRKPSVKGLKIVSEKMKVEISEMIFVGDEEKDMVCANQAGALAVLINRSDEIKQFGQDLEIHSLEELFNIV